MKFRKLILFITVLICSSLFFCFPVLADQEEVVPPPSPEITIKINDVTVEPGKSITYHEGDTVNVHIKWILDGPGDYRFEGDHFTYDLGDILVDPNNRSGAIYNQGLAVGNYWVDEDNLLHITLNPDFADDLNRDIYIDLNGVLPTDQTLDPNGSERDFKIGEETFKAKLEYDASSVVINKNVAGSGAVTLNSEGKYEIKYELNITVNGTIKDLNISDICEEGLNLPEDSGDYLIEFFPNDNKSHNTDPVFSYTDSNNISFSFNGEFHDGDNFKITYSVIVDKDAANTLFKESGNLINTASGTYENNKGETKNIPDSSYPATAIAPTLNKSGAWIDENTIEWTITFNTGSMGDLDDLINNKNRVWELLGIKNQTDLLSYLGLSKFIDELGPGLTGKDLGNLNLSEITLDDFSKTDGPNADGSYNYILIFKTTVNGNELAYRNSVSSTFFGTAIGDSAGVGVGEGLSKDFIEKTDENTLSWKIRVKLPESTDLTEFVITDTPSIPISDDSFNQNADDYGWSHHVIKESIRINGQSPEGIAEVTLGDNHWSAILNFDINSEFFTQNKGQYIEITLETEIVNSLGTRVEVAFFEDFNYVNTVFENINGVPADQAEANYSEIMKSILAKNVADNSITQYTDDVEWYIEITEDFINSEEDSKLTGALISDKPFNLILKDTLPKYMDYIEGSAYVTLSVLNRIEYANNENSDPPANLKQFEEMMSSALMVTDNNDGTITFKWNLTEDLRREIYNFDFKTLGGTSKKFYEGYPGVEGNSIWTEPWNHATLRIYYKSRLSISYEELQEKLGSNDPKFINTVDGTLNGSSAGSALAAATFSKSSALSKDYLFGQGDYENAKNESEDFKNYIEKYAVSASGFYNVLYQIDVNPQRLTFGGENESWITLEDTMGKNLTLILQSIRVTDLDTNEVLDFYSNPPEYTVSVDFEENKFSLKLPDGKHLKVNYFASVDEFPEDLNQPAAEAENKIELFGSYQEMSETDFIPNVELIPSGGASSSDTISFYKYYTDEFGTRPLIGAKFKLTPYTYDRETQQLIEVENKDNNNDFPNITWEKTTDPEITWFKLHNNYVYKVEEVEAPAGFEKSNQVFYFIFPDYANEAVDSTEQKDEILHLGYVQLFEGGDLIYFKNTQIPGSLTITKTFGEEAPSEANEKNYTFSIIGPETASGRSFDLVDGGTVSFNTAIPPTAEVTITGAKSVAIKNLPTGSYHVSEIRDGAGIANYSLEITGERETEITEEKGSVVTVTNTYKELEKGNLTIIKTLGKNAPLGSNDKTYSFTITGSEAVSGGTYNLTGGGTVTFSEAAPYTANVTVIGAGSVTVENLPVGTYTVIEDKESAEIPSYSLTVSGEGDAVISTENSPVITITNTYSSNQDESDEESGSLTVEKTISGTDADPEQSFQFIIELEDKTFNGTPNNVEFTNGYAEISLKGGESKTISNLPANITYSVKEVQANMNGYTTTSTGETGTITTNNDSTASFVNHKDKGAEEDKSTGNLIVQKTVEGSEGDRNLGFNFTVRLSDTSITGTYGKMDFVNGIAEFNLKHGETKIATNLPPGLTYTVAEKEADLGGYQTTSINESGTILEDEIVFAKFINTKGVVPPSSEIEEPKTGDLKISKTVSGSSKDKNQLFHFNITLSDTSINEIYSGIKFSNGIAEISLKHDQSLTISGLPAGISYVVTEVEANKGGFVTTASGDKGTISANNLSYTEFVNNKTNSSSDNIIPSGQGSLSINKTVTGNLGEYTKDFHFIITLSDNTITGKYGDAIFSKGVASITLRHNQSIVISNLPTNITYTVSEVEANQDGYTTTAFGNTGIISQNNLAQAIFINNKTNDTTESTPVQNPFIVKTQQFNEGSITKDNQIVNRGGILTYYIEVSNPTNNTINKVVVTDQIPTGLTYVSGSASDNGSLSHGNIITWNFKTLEPGETKVVSFKTKITSNPVYIQWKNTAQLTWENGIPTSSNTVIAETPQLSILKEQSTSGKNSVGKTTQYIEFVPGDTITYYITVTNTGTVPASDTVISDTIPAGLIYIEGSASSGVQINGDTLTWNIGLLQPGASATVQIEFSCQLPEVVLEKIYFHNIAYVNWNENGTNNPLASNEVITGDPPAGPSSNESFSNGNVNDSNTTTNTTNPTSTSISTVGVSPQTGILSGSLLLPLVGIAIGSSILDRKRRIKKKNNK